MQEGKIIHTAIDLSLNYIQQCNRISSHIKLNLDSFSAGKCKYIIGYFDILAEVTN
jgi:hypothetical protein